MRMLHAHAYWHVHAHLHAHACLQAHAYACLRVHAFSHYFVAAERLKARATVSDALFLWFHVFQIKLFRTLDENMQSKKFYRQQLSRTRHQLFLRNCRRAWDAWFARVECAVRVKNNLKKVSLVRICICADVWMWLRASEQIVGTAHARECVFPSSPL